MMEPAQSLVNAAHDKNQRALAQCMKSIESQPEAEQMRVVNERDSGGRSALHYAALHDLPSLLQWLLLHRAELNLQDGQGQTALHLALKDRHVGAAKQLLQRPEQRVDLRDQFDRLPLHWAAQAGYSELLPRCLQGVDPNSATQGGDTALHWAVMDGHTDCALQLLQRGARVSAKNERGESVVELSRGKGAELERRVHEAEEEERKRRMADADQQSAEVASFTLPTALPDASSTPAAKKPKMTIKLKPKK